MVSKRIAEARDRLLSQEKGTVYKDPGGKISICLVYPNTYHIGMSNLGFQGIYTLLNERPDVVCERAFLPEAADLEEHERTGAEIFSLESKRSLNRFDIVAFSVSFENDYPHILKILALSRIPLRATDRRNVHPLLIMGGVCAFFNPEPLADFFDICFIGEAEEMLGEFIDAYKASDTREELLEKALRIEGLYLPRWYNVSYHNDGRIAQRAVRGNAPEAIPRRFVRNLSQTRFRHSVITPETVFSNMRLVEAMRGCPWNCRFCVTGSVYKPVRKKDLDSITDEIGAASLGSDRVGLIAPSLTDYPHLEAVLCIDGTDFSITSLRATERSGQLMQLMRKHKSVSIAPEAGSERLRKRIHKKISEEDILGTARLIFSSGIENLRLYFMVGLPGENDDDVQGIISLVKKIRAVSGSGMLILTVSTFVPKPFTPFQWHSMERMGVVRDRLKSIKKALIPAKGIKVFHDVPKYAYMQGLFSRGDRRISAVLERMLDEEDWQRASRGAGIDTGFYLFRQREFDEVLPWDFIDNHSSKAKLWAEYQKAIAEGVS